MLIFVFCPKSAIITTLKFEILTKSYLTTLLVLNNTTLTFCICLMQNIFLPSGFLRERENMLACGLVSVIVSVPRPFAITLVLSSWTELLEQTF